MRIAAALTWGLLAAAMWGCTVFTSDVATVGESNTLLKPLVAPIDTVDIEVMFFDVPKDDPLVQDKLWRELDQIASVPAETRLVLAENGLRFGLAGSNPPPTLETLIRMSTEPSALTDPNVSRWSGNRLSVRDGAMSEVETAGVVPVLNTVLTVGRDERLMEFKNARCVMRLQTKLREDGWINLSFLPEIHHGQPRTKHIPAEIGWQIRSAQQEIEPLHRLQFGFDVNLGEMVVVSCSDMGESLGANFFQPSEREHHLQRILVVRFANTHRTNPVRQRVAVR